MSKKKPEGPRTITMKLDVALDTSELAAKLAGEPAKPGAKKRARKP